MKIDFSLYMLFYCFADSNQSLLVFFAVIDS